MTTPAQPVKPAQPVLPNTAAGGYTGPGQRTQRVEPIPQSPASGGTATATPSPHPSSPSPVSPPSQAPAPAAGLPPAAQELGLDQQGYEQVLEEEQEAADPAKFRTRFETLAKQKMLLGTPKGVDERGYHLPSEEQSDYYSEWMNKAVQYATAPQEAGGKGWTIPHARMMAVAEARRRWPHVDPKTWVTLGGRLFPKNPEVDLGENSPPVEFGPTKAAKLDTTKIADLLTHKELQKYIDKAGEYTELAGSAATGTEFAKWLVKDRIARNMEGVKALSNQIDASSAKVQELTAQQTLGQATEEQVAQAKLELAQLKAQQATAPKTGDIQDEAYTWFTKNADLLSVVSSLKNIY